MSQKAALVTALTPIAEAINPMQFVPPGPSSAFQELAYHKSDKARHISPN